MTVFAIDIISDTVCPWCQIGSRRLQKAIELYQKTYPGGSSDTFNITWRPYYLNPSAPKEGIPIQDKMLSRMDPDRVEKIQRHLQSIGTGEGIMFKFGGKTGNSRLSHQLLQLAKTDSYEMQWKVAQEVFRLHLEEEGDITDIQMLVAAGVNAGLDEEKVSKWLQDEEEAKIVDKEVEDVRAMGVKGVPQFLFQGGKHHVDGAKDVMDFFEVIMEVKDEESSK